MIWLCGSTRLTLPLVTAHLEENHSLQLTEHSNSAKSSAKLQSIGHLETAVLGAPGGRDKALKTYLL